VHNLTASLFTTVLTVIVDRLPPRFKMANNVWGVFGNIATATGFTAVAYTSVQGAVAGYQACNSASNSLTESERKLERVRSRLKGLSPQRRDEIEATQGNASGCKSLKDLEEQLEELLDVYFRLFKGYEEATFPMRHYPYSEFRQHVSKLERDAMGLLNDTLTTTVPHLDDMGFDPKKPRREVARPSSLESSTPSAPYPDADAISMSRIVTIV